MHFGLIIFSLIKVILSKFCMTPWCAETWLLCKFLAQEMFFLKNEEIKFQVFRLSTACEKFTKFLLSFLKQPATFSANFVSLLLHCFVITHNSSEELWYFEQNEDMKFQNFRLSMADKNLPNSLYRFWNNLADFLKIMHHSSTQWQITVDTLDRARTWNFKFSNCQLLLWNCNASPALRL